MTIGRLTKRPQFLEVAAKGKKKATPGLVLQAYCHGNPEWGPRVGFTASRKVGNAVARNRARRRLRAVAERILPVAAAPAYDYVLIARKATPERPFTALMADLEDALRRLDLYRNSESAAEPAIQGSRGE
ncbi:MAG: ribonuclease P protein component [Alphaproteobacteria bacterium]|nr:ribonuclease P protein component [Alphaproteobacteria bacterium]